MFSGVFDGRKALPAVIWLVLAPLLAAQSTEAPPAQVLDILKLPRTQRLVISRIQGPIVLDGRLDELAEDRIAPVEVGPRRDTDVDFRIAAPLVADASEAQRAEEMRPRVELRGQRRGPSVTTQAIVDFIRQRVAAAPQGA